MRILQSAWPKGVRPTWAGGHSDGKKQPDSKGPRVSTFEHMDEARQDTTALFRRNQSMPSTTRRLSLLRKLKPSPTDKYAHEGKPSGRDAPHIVDRLPTSHFKPHGSRSFVGQGNSRRSVSLFRKTHSMPSKPILVDDESEESSFSLPFNHIEFVDEDDLAIVSTISELSKTSTSNQREDRYAATPTDELSEPVYTSCLWPRPLLDDDDKSSQEYPGMPWNWLPDSTWEILGELFDMDDDDLGHVTDKFLVAPASMERSTSFPDKAKVAPIVDDCATKTTKTDNSGDSTIRYANTTKAAKQLPVDPLEQGGKLAFGETVEVLRKKNTIIIEVKRGKPSNANRPTHSPRARARVTGRRTKRKGRMYEI